MDIDNDLVRERPIRMHGRAREPMKPLKCNGCTLCCKNDLIILHPEWGDDQSQYATVEVINPLTGKPVLALDRNKDDNCIYLGEFGCTIYDRRPVICREFDCRKFALTIYECTTRQERRKLFRNGGGMNKSVIKRGLEKAIEDKIP